MTSDAARGTSSKFEGCVPFFCLVEKTSAGGVPRLVGRLADSSVVGWPDRDIAAPRRRWQIFAEPYERPGRPPLASRPRVYLFALEEVVSRNGVPRLVGRFGPVKVIGYRERGSATRWQLYLERYESWNGGKPTDSREIAHNVVTGEKHG